MAFKILPASITVSVGNSIEKTIKNLTNKIPSCFYKAYLEIFGEEGHFANIGNTQTTHVPFTNVLIGLKLERVKSVQ